MSLLDYAPATAQGEQADLLTSLALDAWLLATYGSPGNVMPDGRVWERSVMDSLVHPGISRRQYAGQTELFGQGSASGCRHELDGAADGWAGRVVMEAKARADGLAKTDVAVFDLKIRDYYIASMPTASSDQWWSLMVSASPIRSEIRCLCATLAIIPVEPRILPLPVLTWFAGRDSASRLFRAPVIREILRIGERAAAPLQKRWVPDGISGLRYDTSWWASGDLDDLVWLQEEMSGDILDLYDREAPDRLPSRASNLMERVRRRQGAAS